MSDGKSALTGTLVDQRCPQCGGRLWLEWRLKAKPVGEFSLSGAQMKFSAYETPWLSCEDCGMSVEGRMTRDVAGGDDE